jgi:hypothetical protein
VILESGNAQRMIARCAENKATACMMIALMEEIRVSPQPLKSVLIAIKERFVTSEGLRAISTGGMSNTGSSKGIV